ncbi:hypothetical protein C0J52_05202 [Blattella germanica]|nr:hypothetical protein C0J52_05202 [Blattella germanica]
MEIQGGAGKREISFAKGISTAQDNPREFHERPLHSTKVTVWCAVSSHSVIEP